MEIMHSRQGVILVSRQFSDLIYKKHGVADASDSIMAQFEITE